jgi:GNAT superfamily N-acetyltransferase
MTERFIITPENPATTDAAGLLNELSDSLTKITGASGQASFDLSDVSGPRAIFVIARNVAGVPVGCGALRPLSETVAEVKRMYSKQSGAGRAILKYLETQALALNYKELRLETRRVNEFAANFYRRNGFREIPNYGKYIGNPLAVCFGKIIIKTEQNRRFI